jgi:hypothetical protein
MSNNNFSERQTIRITKPSGDFCYYNRRLNSKLYVFYNIIGKFISTKPIHLQNITSKQVYLGRRIVLKF